MVRFLHTSDWQLGMTRNRLSAGAQERFSQDRFDAVRALGRVARTEGCAFVAVCGDVFDSNQVDRKTVARALEALQEVPVPVFLLPGNHDPLNAATVYRSGTFLERKPPHVRVLETTEPVGIAPGVELLGAPWTSRRPARNPLAEALAAPPPGPGVLRVCLAHGAVDVLAPDREDPGVLALADLDRALADGRVHFVALGDRHSLTKVGPSGRIWYSGAPEATDFSEAASGRALLVEADLSGVSTREVSIGRWRFVEWPRVDLNSAEDVDGLLHRLRALEDKERSLVRLNLVGSLPLSAQGVLEERLAAEADVFAALDVRDEALLALPAGADFEDLHLSGFAEAAVQRLRARIAAGGAAAGEARDALGLLIRLAAPDSRSRGPDPPRPGGGG